MRNSLEAENNILTIIPSVPYWRDSESLVFDRKFYDGIIKYGEYWPGSIRCIMNLSLEALPDFGCVRIDISDCPFEFIGLNNHDFLTAEHLKSTAIILAAADSFSYKNLDKLRVGMGIKFVYIIEYILETRYQIVALEKVNIFRKLRRLLYVYNNERARINALKNADGLQANGVPAFSQYGAYAPSSLLYFDTRIKSADYITEEQLDGRLNYLLTNQPLRLSFSGRLNKMKGADHLIQVALGLREKGIGFIFNIYGDGDLKSSMIENIKRHGLSDKVKMHGALSFYDELLPEIKNNTDIFICCHRQSDPSCTYLETLSCGVPILGYDNKAFSGILDLADVGWATTMGKISPIVDMIDYLNQNRVEIVKKSKNALSFSSSHSFEKTYMQRINHLLKVVQL